MTIHGYKKRQEMEAMEELVEEVEELVEEASSWWSWMFGSSSSSSSSEPKELKKPSKPKKHPKAIVIHGGQHARGTLNVSVPLSLCPTPYDSTHPFISYWGHAIKSMRRIDFCMSV